VRADSFAADEQPKTVDRTDTKGKAGDAVNFEVKTPAPGFNPIDAAKASAPQ
jgi:hypothetical protein